MAAKLRDAVPRWDEEGQQFHLAKQLRVLAQQEVESVKAADNVLARVYAAQLKLT
jgi:hypothetical protein